MPGITYIKDLVFLWGIVVAIITATIVYYESCKPCLDFYSIEIFLGLLTITTTALLWFTFSYKVKKIDTDLKTGLDSIHIALLKADVDRFYSQHKHCEQLSEDDMKYLFMLKDKLDYYKINSFTQRKVNTLLDKGIK